MTSPPDDPTPLPPHDPTPPPADDRARWDVRHAAAPFPAVADPALTSLSAWLPKAGRVLDVAGGCGGNATWMASRGLEVVVADVSPQGLARAAAGAALAGLSVRTVHVDLAREPLPPGPWEAVVVVNFLDRVVLRRLHRVLRPGGVAIVVHPTVRNLERHAHPSARWLLEAGELPGLLASLAPVYVEERWFPEDGDGARHLARLVALRA